MTRALVLLLALLVSLPSVTRGQVVTLAGPTDVFAEDVPDDIGGQVLVKWSLSSEDHLAADGSRPINGYAIYRKVVPSALALESGAEAAAGPGELGFADDFDYEANQPVGTVPYSVSQFLDENVEPDVAYMYGIAATGPGGTYSPVSSAAAPVIAKMEYINQGKLWFFIIMMIISIVIVYFVFYAKRGGKIKVRPIAGLEAVTEAVGRSTEMGKPVLFVPGILDINDIQTVAGITVLSNVARTAAQYDAELKVPTARSLVMTTARETVEAAYLGEGRPDAYNEDNIYYLTDEQFGYTAGVQGAMVREKPAACFYMGAFYAESLILAETANSIGAIQIAGTAMPSQLPFFVAACDYTLIGEEFFAASAYLSNDPEQLGSLKGQDLGKVIAAFLLILGCLLATLATVVPASKPIRVAELYIKNNVLGEDGLVPNELKIAVLDGELNRLMEADQDAQPAIQEGGN
ncbi:MAG: hypothetical protein P8M22_06765 [Phycisphaerales bacterium]|nr:hypothetical protein [Phycisphaerales bacterium]